MPPKKYAIKGEPDFHTVSDKQLEDYLEFAQQLIHAYKYESPEKAKVLEQVWKDISNEKVDRIKIDTKDLAPRTVKPIKSKEPVVRPVMVKKPIIRKPLKNKN